MGKIAKLIYLDSEMVVFFENQKKSFNISSYIRDAIREKLDRDNNVIVSKDNTPEDDDQLEIKRLKIEEAAKKSAEFFDCKEKKEAKLFKADLVRKVARIISETDANLRQGRYDQFINTTMKYQKEMLDQLLKEMGIKLDYSIHN